MHLGTLTSNEKRLIVAAVLISVITGFLTMRHIGNVILVFFISGVALAMLAKLVGSATEQAGQKLSSGATGVLQGALGNLPELFIGIFSLKAGLVSLVQAALVGSILANSLLVLGLAFLAGGLKHGTQRFEREQPRMTATLMLLAVCALIIPTLANVLGTPAAAHPRQLSVACAIVLLVIFVASIPMSLKGSSPCIPEMENLKDETPWPMWLTLTVLVGASVGAAFISECFVDNMQPAIKILHLTQTFTGLVIVAIAGNAVENLVGVQLALKNKMDLAVSVILNSPLQIALGLGPALVLISTYILGGHVLTLVLPPLLVVALFLSTLVSLIVVVDGESIWLEGAALIGLYLIIAAAFWWG